MQLFTAASFTEICKLVYISVINNFNYYLIYWHNVGNDVFIFNLMVHPNKGCKITAVDYFIL